MRQHGTSSTSSSNRAQLDSKIRFTEDRFGKTLISQGSWTSVIRPYTLSERFGLVSNPDYCQEGKVPGRSRAGIGKAKA